MSTSCANVARIFAIFVASHMLSISVHLRTKFPSNRPELSEAENTKHLHRSIEWTSFLIRMMRGRRTNE